MNNPKIIPIIVISALVLFILNALVKILTYVTPPGHATVIFNTLSGLQKDRIEPPGITLLKPFVDRPITYNVRTKVWSFTNEENVNKAGSAINVNSADGQAFDMDVYLALRPNQETLDDLHSQVGENYMNTVVVPVARSKIRDISAKFNSQDFYQQEKRAVIAQQATQLIAEEMPMGETQGQTIPLINIEGIFLGTPNFPQGLKDSIERKQVASITAQTAAVKAEIQQKETEKVLILAKADQKAIELKGQAASANAKLADLLLYESLEKRVADLKVIRVESNSPVFLNVDPKQIAVSQQE